MGEIGTKFIIVIYTMHTAAYILGLLVTNSHFNLIHNFGKLENRNIRQTDTSPERD